MTRFTPGLVVEHPYSRTVTQEDNLFATLTALNTAQAHFNRPMAMSHLDGRFTDQLVVGSCVLAIAMGLASAGWHGYVVERELGLESLRFPSPVFPGDTVTVRSTVTGAAPDALDGVVVDTDVEMVKDGGVVVLQARRRLRLVPDVR